MLNFVFASVVPGFETWKHPMSYAHVVREIGKDIDLTLVDFKVVYELLQL